MLRCQVFHLLRSILKAFRSRLQISLYRSCGLPRGRLPCTYSPCRRSFGIRPSAILTTCPSQCRRRCFSNVYMLKIPAHSRTTLFGTLSCQMIPKIRQRQCIWKVFSFLSCRAQTTKQQQAQVVFSWQTKSKDSWAFLANKHILS